jgi:uncharacterized protein (TIGR03437 family)
MGSRTAKRILQVGFLFLCVLLGRTSALAQAPNISGLNYNSGGVGQSVYISGSNFGNSQGSSTVTFNGTAATPNYWNTALIITPVPAGATSGHIVVTVGGVASNGVNFTVTTAPTITGLNYYSGGVGLSLYIAGSNFGNSQGSSTVSFNGTPGTPVGWNPEEIVVPVPQGATSGNIVVTVGGVASDPMSFTVVQTPGITNLSDTSGNVGTEIWIYGWNLGNSQGSSTVTFDGMPASANFWTEGLVIVTVPDGGTTGNVVITVGGVASNGVGFTVTGFDPSVTSLSPNSGGINTAVTIAGSGFGSSQSTSQGMSTVTFNGTSATPTSWSNTSIVVPVPTGTTTGSVVVTVGSVESNAVNFQVSGSSSGYVRPITISHLQVPNTNQTDFPVLISGTYSYLATTPHGGNVANANGYDIVFTSDAAGNNPLNWEVESYNPTNGTVVIWVQIPTLSYTTDTVIYMWYGNSSISTFQSKGSPWDSTFGGVWHLANGTTLSAKDSTTNGNNGTLSSSPPTATTGMIDGAASFNGSTNYITVPGSASLRPANAFTFSEWVYVPSTSPVDTFMDLGLSDVGGVFNGMFIFYFGPGNSFEAPFYTSSGFVNLQTSTALPTNAWSLIHVTYNGTYAITYINGVRANWPLSATGTVLFNGGELDLGTYSVYEGTPSAPFTGSQDEVRVANVARSADWITTEYNNQSNPSGFYSVGSASGSGGGGGGSGSGPAINGLSPSSGQVGTTVTITGTNFGSSQGTVTFTSTIAPPTDTVPAVITSWSTSQIVVQVPDGTTTGPVVVTVNGVASTGNPTFTASGGCISPP